MIAKEQKKKLLILSVIQPYSEEFVHSSDHLPKLLQGIFKLAYLENDYSQLVTLAESNFHENIKAVNDGCYSEAIVRSKAKWHSLL